MDALLPEERELAMKVFGEEMPLADYAKMRGKIPRSINHLRLPRYNRGIFL